MHTVNQMNREAPRLCTTKIVQAVRDLLGSVRLGLVYCAHMRQARNDNLLRKVQSDCRTSSDLIQQDLVDDFEAIKFDHRSNLGQCRHVCLEIDVQAIVGPLARANLNELLHKR